MSGKIELIVRKVNPRWGNKYNLKYYPGWIWRITSDDKIKKQVEFMPSWDEIERAIYETVLHEMKIDKVIERNGEWQRYTKFLKEMIKKCQSLQNRTINYSEIDPVILECKNEETN